MGCVSLPVSGYVCPALPFSRRAMMPSRRVRVGSRWWSGIRSMPRCNRPASTSSAFSASLTNSTSFFSPGSKVGQSEVLHLEEPSCDRPAAAEQRRYLEPEHASFPSGRRPGRFRSDPVGVVPVGLVEERSITDRTVDLDRPFWIVSRVEVSLHRAKQACGRGRELSEDRLTTNDDDLIPGDIGRRVDEVLEFDPVHEAARASTARAIL